MKTAGRFFMLMTMFAFACTTDFHGESDDGEEQDLAPDTVDDRIDVAGDDVDLWDGDVADMSDMVDMEDIDDMVDGEEIEYECLEAGDCDDGNPCNGEETCNLDSNMCEDGNPPDEGFVCGSDPRSICLEEECVASSCGDGFVDTGGGESCEPPGEGSCDSECNLECTGDGDCPDDGNPCNGEEFCDTSAGHCDRRNPLDDGDACGDSPRRICLSGTCQESICGDSFTDGGMTPPEECDDGNGEQGDGCDNDCTFSCHSDTECDDHLPCSVGTCNMTAHVCEISFLGSGTVCRAAAGICDVEETCDGANAACPADEFHASSYVCRGSAGDCDIEERCTGTSAACPADSLEPSTTVCRGSSGTCDPAENCTGTSANCPANLFAPSSTVCRSAAGTCDIAENCTGTSAACPTDAYRSSSYECRSSAGVCDIAESCTGTSPNCPTDVFRPSSSVCRAQNGVCDAAENCSGTSAACPTDVYLSGTTCRSAAGPCDVAEVCDGTSRDCPTNAFRPPTYICNAAAGPCDAIEYCPGDGTLCPSDQLLPAGTVCRAKARYCDIEEVCTGTSVGCPADLAEPYLFGVTHVGAGFAGHTCAVVSTGDVKCWGDNNYGQLGVNASTTDRPEPVDVGGLPASATQVETGQYFSCARLSNSTVYCWGMNNVGQLGNGGTTTSHIPTRVGSLSTITSISVGQSHACARTSDSYVYCWGDNSQYQLGDNTTVSHSTTPVLVEYSTGTTVSTIVEIACGYEFCCGRTGIGNVLCWGSDSYGSLGNNSPSTDQNFADYVTNTAGTNRLSNVADIGAGGYHGCAHFSTPDQTVCWGLGSSGQIGSGSTITTNYLPLVVVNSSSSDLRGVTSLDLGQQFSCARAGSDAMCWGEDSNGQLGDGTAGTDRNYADFVIDIIGSVYQVSAGFQHACARLSDSTLRCWGANNYGQLGIGSIDTNAHPTPMIVVCE